MQKPAPKLAFVLRRAPYGSSYATEALDAVLTASAYGLDITVLFTDDGVLQLVDGQRPRAIGMKPFTAAIDGLALYGIKPFYACESALKQRGLKPGDLFCQPELVSPVQIRTLLDAADHILTF